MYVTVHWQDDPCEALTIQVQRDVVVCISGGKVVKTIERDGGTFLIEVKQNDEAKKSGL